VSTVEKLKQVLDAEEASESLNAIPADTYVKLSRYAQKLRATAAPSYDDAPARLARKQLWLIETMSRQLLQVRMEKARKTAAQEGQPFPPSRGLLPEELYLDEILSQVPKREDRLVRAVVDGQPSFFTLVQRREMQKMTTVRISKRVGEIMGADLKKYGPFEVNDVTRLPAGNARAMVASNQAVVVSTDD
jgi:DNA replication initiation complex subunit (GINS family)